MLHAFDEIFEILEDEKDELPVAFFIALIEHSNKPTEPLILIYLGIGVVTFKKSGLDAVKDIDLKHLILETDSPYLAPSPNRGKRNESSTSFGTAQKLADLHQVPIESLAKITTDNSVKPLAADMK